MDSSIYEKVYHLGTSECDYQGRWKISSMIEAYQSVANEHSSNLHLWYSDLKSLNLSLVLYKTSFTIERYPALGEKVTIITYTKGVRTMYLPRYYIVYDSTDNIIARGGSLLMLIDKVARKAILPKSVGLSFPDAENFEPSVRIPLRKPNINGFQKAGLFRPQYTDIDINGHVNNVRYIDVLCNTFGLELMDRYQIKNATIEYNAEILPNDMISLILKIDESKRQFCLVGRKNEEICFDIYGNFHLKYKELQVE